MKLVHLIILAAPAVVGDEYNYRSPAGRACRAPLVLIRARGARIFHGPIRIKPR